MSETLKVHKLVADVVTWACQFWDAVDGTTSKKETERMLGKAVIAMRAAGITAVPVRAYTREEVDPVLNRMLSAHGAYVRALHRGVFESDEALRSARAAVERMLMSVPAPDKQFSADEAGAMVDRVTAELLAELDRQMDQAEEAENRAKQAEARIRELEALLDANAKRSAEEETRKMQVDEVERMLDEADDMPTREAVLTLIKAVRALNKRVKQ